MSEVVPYLIELYTIMGEIERNNKCLPIVVLTGQDLSQNGEWNSIRRHSPGLVVSICERFMTASGDSK